MAVYVALLRGVNVVGSSVMKMDALREMCCDLRFQDVQTYLQSGNVIFRCRETNETALAKKLSAGIEKQFGFRPQVMLRTPDELRAVVAANPFAKRKDIHPSKLLVNFLLGPPPADLRAKIEAIQPLSSEEIHLIGRELFIYFPAGIGASKTRGVLDRVLKTTATGRNWNSVTNVLAMAEKLER
jgi:uncharacterized protein (DUF1697 family)